MLVFGRRPLFINKLNPPRGPLTAYAAPPPPAYRERKPPEVEPRRKPDSNVRRNKLDVLRVPFDAGYSRDCGGLGLTTYLLKFKYKGCFDQEELDSQLLHK